MSTKRNLDVDIPIHDEVEENASPVNSTSTGSLSVSPAASLADEDVTDIRSNGNSKRPAVAEQNDGLPMEEEEEQATPVHNGMMTVYTQSQASDSIQDPVVSVLLSNSKSGGDAGIPLHPSGEDRTGEEEDKEEMEPVDASCVDMFDDDAITNTAAAAASLPSSTETGGGAIQRATASTTTQGRGDENPPFGNKQRRLNHVKEKNSAGVDDLGKSPKKKQAGVAAGVAAETIPPLQQGNEHIEKEKALQDGTEQNKENDDPSLQAKKNIAAKINPLQNTATTAKSAAAAASTNNSNDFESTDASCKRKRERLPVEDEPKKQARINHFQSSPAQPPWTEAARVSDGGRRMIKKYTLKRSQISEGQFPVPQENDDDDGQDDDFGTGGGDNDDDIPKSPTAECEDDNQAPADTVEVERTDGNDDPKAPEEDSAVEIARQKKLKTLDRNVKRARDKLKKLTKQCKTTSNLAAKQEAIKKQEGRIKEIEGERYKTSNINEKLEWTKRKIGHTGFQLRQEGISNETKEGLEKLLQELQEQKEQLRSDGSLGKRVEPNSELEVVEPVEAAPIPNNIPDASGFVLLSVCALKMQHTLGDHCVKDACAAFSFDRNLIKKAIFENYWNKNNVQADERIITLELAVHLIVKQPGHIYEFANVLQGAYQMCGPIKDLYDLYKQAFGLYLVSTRRSETNHVFVYDASRRLLVDGPYERSETLKANMLKNECIEWFKKWGYLELKNVFVVKVKANAIRNNEVKHFVGKGVFTTSPK